MTSPTRTRSDECATRWASSRSAGLAILAVAALALGACGSTPTPSVWSGLRTIDTTGQACGGVGLVDATIHGSPTDPRVAWIQVAGWPDESVVFPTGFTAQFSPSLEILDATGAVVFREGDRVEGGCVAGDHTLLIGWP